MKTAELLAKILPSWPESADSLQQRLDGSIYSYTNGVAVLMREYYAQGLSLAGDVGVHVTQEGYCDALRALRSSQAASKSKDTHQQDEERYQAKLNCLRDCLVTIANRDCSVSRSNAEGIADAVSAAFDKIKM